MSKHWQNPACLHRAVKTEAKGTEKIVTMGIVGEANGKDWQDEVFFLIT